jgi:hypothetical protein
MSTQLVSEPETTTAAPPVTEPSTSDTLRAVYAAVLPNISYSFEPDLDDVEPFGSLLGLFRSSVQAEAALADAIKELANSASGWDLRVNDGMSVEETLADASRVVKLHVESFGPGRWWAAFVGDFCCTSHVDNIVPHAIWQGPVDAVTAALIEAATAASGQRMGEMLAYTLNDIRVVPLDVGSSLTMVDQKFGLLAFQDPF